jgi:phosphatidate phosphatase LPIN
MQYVRSVSSSVTKTWNSINPATLSGAIDVIVVEQDDGESPHTSSIATPSPHLLMANRIFGLFSISCPLRQVLAASTL